MSSSYKLITFLETNTVFFTDVIFSPSSLVSLLSYIGYIRDDYYHKGFPCGSAGKESSCNVGDLGSIPGLGRSPGEGKGYLLQYSGLENFMDCIVHVVAKSHTRLSDFHSLTHSISQFTSQLIVHHYIVLELEEECWVHQLIRISIVSLWEKEENICVKQQHVVAIGMVKTRKGNADKAKAWTV